MSSEFYSVEQVAEKLGLHVRTVRNYVRDGRLKAVRIGKQYRVAREDLDALVGHEPPTARYVEVSSVVRIDGIDAHGASRLTTTLTAMANVPRDDDGPLRIEAVHDPARASLKIIVLGSASTTAELLKVIDHLTGEIG